MAGRHFVPEQKIFAKVRGYPPWPAKVLAAMDETPGKQKYNVYFYGTHETAILKVDELFDFVDYKDKYGVGKPLKRKFFPEAMQEVEADLDPTKSCDSHAADTSTGVGNVSSTVCSSTPIAATAAATLPRDKDSDDEGNLVIDETPTATQPKPKPVKHESAAKNLKRKLSSSSFDVSTDTSPMEITSRSGRKIKPKKFLGESSEFSTSTPVYQKSKSKTNKDTTTTTTMIPPTTIVTEENGKPSNKLEDTTGDVTNGDGAGDEIELHWDGVQNAQQLIDKSERSDLPKHIKKDFKKSIKKKVDEVRTQKLPLADTENLELMKIEVNLVDAEMRIKSSLNLSYANCEDCLKAMDEILDLKLNAVILKKQPEVVDTVKKLRKYVGNVTQWEMTPEQKSKFLDDASKIRMKAETMYNKFQSLFTIPQDKSFFEVFSSEVAAFKEKTSRMKLTDLYSLTKEPAD